MTRPTLLILSMTALLAGCAGEEASSAAAAIQPGDLAMTCPQIVQEITRQNALVAGANGVAQQPGQSSGTSGGYEPSTTAPTPEQRQSQSEGTGAQARATALVGLGRQKKCFL